MALLVIETSKSKYFGSEDRFWHMKIWVSKKQALVLYDGACGPGIGFLREKGAHSADLPITCSVNAIYNNISENKGKRPKKRHCLLAIQLLVAEGRRQYIEKHGAVALDGAIKRMAELHKNL